MLPRCLRIWQQQYLFKVENAYAYRVYARLFGTKISMCSAKQNNDSGDRTYENAINIINSRQRQKRPDRAAEQINRKQIVPSTNGNPKFKGTPSITGMAEWLEILGHDGHTINALNVIHIAGTKGKGSTCAFAESFLRAHGQRTGHPRKTGMYTSPHLIFPEERIRIDSKPLERSSFAKYFFEVYDKLPQLALPYDPAKPVVERGPRSLQLYALLAFHVFIQEKVDVTILETHSGGEYDATNVVQKPIVTAITTLGMDHVDMLGPGIQNIAWHKSGIFKPGAVALSSTQDVEPAQVLDDRGREKGVSVRFVNPDWRLPPYSSTLRPAVQKQNASLALAVTEAFLQSSAQSEDPRLTQVDINTGIQQWMWPGRFQVVPNGQMTWFLDAAHNEMSVKIAADWFAELSSESEPSGTRILIFSHINELRDALELLRSLANALKQKHVNMAHVVFTTYDASKGAQQAMTGVDPDEFDKIWRRIFPACQVSHESTVRGAIQCVRKLAGQRHSGAQVLVTGSQHLVGPALQILEGG